jgi:RNase_H superfamily
VFLHRLGYRGGLKRIERQWGIIREDDVVGLNGFDAVLLWARYRCGDAAALERLMAYNRADVVNLEVLLKRGYDMARDQLWGAAKIGSGGFALPIALCASPPSSPFERGQEQEDPGMSV